jgi:PHD/YefM family antitoxin component YafN of YafNO toxin-antitoxin module
MAISSTRLRQNLYSILDQVIDTGVPVEVERKGHTLRIVPDKTVSKWERLELRTIVSGNPDDLVHIDWSGEWQGRDALP